MSEYRKTNLYQETYPAYFDFDLEKNHEISKIEIQLPDNEDALYTLYLSLDGRDFHKIAEKEELDGKSSGCYIFSNQIGRILRIAVEYQTPSSCASLKEAVIYGETLDTPVLYAPPIQIEPFEKSCYHNEITEQDTLHAVEAIVSDFFGEHYLNWFRFSILEDGDDRYQIWDEKGKIHIAGNNGVSLASGLNHYLKYYCNVCIAQTGSQLSMPDAPPQIGHGKVLCKEAKTAIRYAYNYCTFSYTMAFWGEKEWRREISWLALNGINLVLDITAQEEVWRRFLTSIGYSHEAVKSFLVGPAYYAWAYMSNMFGFGGPIHDSWFASRTELARKNQHLMRILGMTPILQGYSGSIPTDISKYDPNAVVLEQGTWASFTRPYFLDTTSPSYQIYAARFYQCQKEVYGDITNYYATDPFHEGGNTGNLNPSDVSEQLMLALLKADPNAIWIIQGWHPNPSDALLAGLCRPYQGQDYRSHALVLDLYGEKLPNWKNREEFHHIPWVYCMLNDFGGRMGMHGHMDNLLAEIQSAAASAHQLKGIGITPESTFANPILYDFFLELAWKNPEETLGEKIDQKDWIRQYVTRRYGTFSQSAFEAMLILVDTVYKGECNQQGEGATESILNARPALEIKSASTWGNAVIGYDKDKLKQAARLFLTDYDYLKHSDGYLYDAADLLKQVLANTMQDLHSGMSDAFTKKELAFFDSYAEKFTSGIRLTERVLSTRPEFLLGTWLEQTKQLASDTDDVTKKLYEENARMLITTWGSKINCEEGGLGGYSNRQWAGLTNDLYGKRWNIWIESRREELLGKPVKDTNWFEIDWLFTRQQNVYSNCATEEPLDLLCKEILALS